MIKCSACGKEMSEEEAKSGEAVFQDPKTGTALCFSCGLKMMQQVSAQRQSANNSRPFVPGHDELAVEQQKAAVLQARHESVQQLLRIVSNESPSKIKAHLDQYIIGQDEAKKRLAVAVYNHYKRLAFMENRQLQELETGKPMDNLPKIQKSNILLLGPSGVGKTAMLEAIADYLGVPFAVVDSSSLTQQGYVGSDPETCVRQLWEEAGKNREKTERGIIFLDEFDKIARKSGTNRSTSADPGHEGVQQALLKIIEGGKVHISQANRKHPDAPTFEIDTTNILFVCGGAFEGIDKIISKRVDQGNGFGYGHEDKIGIDGIEDETDRYNKLIDEATHEDVKKYGIIPEMLGRLPVMCKLHQLKEDDLVNIMTKPKNALIKQYSILFKMDGCRLKVAPGALNDIAKKALETGTGARALRTIVEDILLNTMYDLPEIAEDAEEGKVAQVKITEESVETKKPLISYVEKEQKIAA